jgi:hypothetical protein
MAELPKFLAPYPVMYMVTHDIGENHPDNFAGRKVRAGEVFYKFIGNHYSSEPLPGRALISAAGPRVYPFFEFPLFALTAYNPNQAPTLQMPLPR